MRIYVMKARDSKQHYKVHCAINYSNLTMSEAEPEELEDNLNVEAAQ